MLARQLDIPQEEFDRIAARMAIAFKNRSHKGKKIEDPLLYSRNVLRSCIYAEKLDGTPWRGCPGAKADDDMVVLMKRLKVYSYELATGTIIPQKKGRPKKNAQNIIAGLLPSESDPIDKRVKYGSNISQILTKEENKEYKKFLKELQKDFPELDTVSDRLGMEVLAMLKIRMMRINVELASKKGGVIHKDAAEISKLYKETTDSLGISGKQRKNELDREGGNNIADLVKRWHRTLQNYPKEEKRRYMDECRLFLEKFKRNEIEEEDVVRNVNKTIPEIKELLKDNGII